MRLIGVVHMVAVHALLLGIALVEELGCHLREHGVGQHVLFLRCPLGGFGLQLVHLGSQRVGKAAGEVFVGEKLTTPKATVSSAWAKAWMRAYYEKGKRAYVSLAPELSHI